MAEVDLDYNFDSSVLNTGNIADPDHNNVPILVQQFKENEKLIAKHSTFDVIDPNSKLTWEQQALAHQLFVTFLRSYNQDLATKLKELSNAG